MKSRRRGGVISLKDVDRVFTEKKIAELKDLKSRGSTQRNREIFGLKFGEPPEMLSPQNSRPPSPNPFGRGKRRKTRRRRHSNWR